MKIGPPARPPTTFDASAFSLGGDDWIGLASEVDRSESLGKWLDYEVLSTGLRGGQAVVYRCRRTDGRIVAVKRIHGGAAATFGAKRRLQREIDVASALTHPHIVRGRTIDAGDELLIESDWIDGLALVDWCRGPDAGAAPDEPAVLRVMMAVCDAVQFAHEHGIIHRDLKPSNILVDGDHEPHILDFGLAGTLTAFSPEMSRASLSEPLIGTPAYASPEQVAGEPLDVRTDVYSLGVLLYEAFTGVGPYPADLSLGRLLLAVESTEPLRPRLRRPSISRSIEAVIVRAMRKDAALRYQTAAELRADLQRCLDGSRPTAKPPGLWFDLKSFAQRNPTFAWTVACAGSALLAIAVVVAIYAVRLSQAQGDTLAAHQAAERANDILSDMIERAVPPIDDGGARLVSVLDGTSGWLEEELRDQPWALARAHVTIGSLYAKAERWAQADEHLSRALNDYRLLGDPDRKTVARAMRLLGLARAYLGHLDALQEQQRAMAIAQRVSEAGAAEIANFHAAMAETLVVSGRSGRADADAEIEQALSLLRGQKERFPAWEAELVSGYARALLHAGDETDAVHRLLEASALFEEAQMPIETCPYHRATLAMLATAYDAVGDTAAASEVRRRLENVRGRATSVPPYTIGEDK